MPHHLISTCGLVDGIDKLADLQLQLTLSVSLHAPDDETRSRLMPVNRSVGVERLMESCRRYFAVTGRRISFEYAMVDGVNDQDWQADLLVKRLKGMRSHVNLIPLNDVAESPLKPSRRVAGSAAIGAAGHHLHGAAEAGERHRRLLRPAAPQDPERAG